MAQTFLFLNQMVTCNIALILNIVTWLLYLGMTKWARCGWPARTLDTSSRAQRPETKLEPFKGVSSAAGFMSQRNMTIYWYQDCERELRQVFAFQDKSSLVYWNNIAGLIKSMGLEYDAKKWRLFTDSSSRSLKAVQHNGNSFHQSLLSIQFK